MDDCAFCRIVTGDLPCFKIYEDNDYLAFLDIQPISYGHLMVIPKTHYRYTWNVPEFGKYWEVAKKLTMAVLKSLNADKVNYVTLGEAIPHAHIHIVPRNAKDNLGGLPDWSKTKTFSDAEMKEVADKIKASL